MSVTDQELTTGRRPGAGRGRIAIAIAVVAVLLLGYLLARSRQGEQWKSVWVDNFDGAANSAPAEKNWFFDTGTSYPGGAALWGTGEVESYTADPANASLDGHGKLRITATRNDAGAWTSARLETRRNDFQAPPGGVLKVEARIKTPDGGQGYWPAFWMLGKDFRGNYTNWPRIGEIDIMENIGRERSSVHGTLHCGITPGGPCDENNGVGGSATLPDGSSLSAGFHTYSIQWDRSTPSEEIRWYLDGHRYFTVHQSDVSPATWAEATQHGFFLLLNVAVGGGWPGAPDGSTKPNSAMLVDYVSVSRR
jgi:beta-glucanase (GH16 family)